MNEFFEAIAPVLGFLSYLVTLYMGYIIGVSHAEHTARKKSKIEKARKEGSLVGMTAAEAYLSGFKDATGYATINRIKEFKIVGFGDKYEEGWNSGKTKLQAEIDTRHL